jgi:hypothetical protein
MIYTNGQAFFAREYQIHIVDRVAAVIPLLPA